MGNVKRTDSLLFKFGMIFIIFTLVTITLSGAVTYFNQNEEYKRQCESRIKEISVYLGELLTADGEDFLLFQEYCMKHHSEMNIPIDFEDTDASRSRFELMFAERYPGKVLGDNITFSDLDPDVQLAYAEYNHEYYLLEFEKAAKIFDIPYIYYMTPDPEAGENNLMYIIDFVREPRKGEGAGYIDICASYPVSRTTHHVLWETWETGKSLHEIDIIDNEYGKTYAYYTPLYINDIKLGLVAADIEIEKVNAGILRNTLIQSISIGMILIVCVLIMLLFINTGYIRKISELESIVREFATEKDPAIAEKIRNSVTGNNEISSLSIQTAEMVEKIDGYIEDIEKMMVEKVRLGADLNIATKIQSDMLPKDFTKRDEFELYATMTPAKEVGGDFYDFFKIDSDHIGLVMADVSGKGIPAALFMVITKTLIQDRALLGRSPARVLEYTNERLSENNESAMFVTVWLGVLEISTGKLTYANAGHEYPAIKRADGVYALITSENDPPLATIDELEYTDTKITLTPGDSLFLYTDGLPEAKSADGLRFGNDNMLEMLNKNLNLSAEELLKLINGRIDEFSGDDLFDDVTMMCVNYYGKKK